ncbi:unnamed protein product [Rhizoctonia solani]|uniref:Chitin-binding type-3 domain-containing protein n=1 Tax=Rhizoctonia solani TaxID=456999 RepID=A0A8H2XWT5_9AGAM|nr:unnamed protein product [Rhizoctonia solani]
MKSAPEWRPDIPYTAGDVVTYKGECSRWIANQWNQNQVPGGASGAWNEIGNANWHSNTAYVAGSIVIYNGHKWSAKEWNWNQRPGSSGVWTDLGSV